MGTKHSQKYGNPNNRQRDEKNDQTDHIAQHWSKAETKLLGEVRIVVRRGHIEKQRSDTLSRARALELTLN